MLDFAVPSDNELDVIVSMTDLEDVALRISDDYGFEIYKSPLDVLIGVHFSSGLARRGAASSAAVLMQLYPGYCFEEAEDSQYVGFCGEKPAVLIASSFILYGSGLFLSFAAPFGVKV